MYMMYNILSADRDPRINRSGMYYRIYMRCDTTQNT